MKPYYEEPNVVIYCGDARETLAGMEAESVQCVVTSPPYWGLRDYGLAPLAWGGDPACEHEWGGWIENHDEREAKIRGKSRTTERAYGDASRRFDGNHQKHTAGSFCLKCGAWKGSLGLEPTPELYIQHLVEIFREVRRVLRRDGTLWLNLGDVYVSGKGSCLNPGGGENSFSGISRLKKAGAYITNRTNISDLKKMGLKPKDLCMIPSRVALALQSDGWWLRSDIIWSKPNPMPESVRDRPTRSHDYLFLLTKSARYFYDAEAIKELGVYCKHGVGWRGADNKHTAIECSVPDENGKKTKRVRFIGDASRAYSFARVTSTEGKPGEASQHRPDREDIDYRNRRSVWIIATQPYKDAHFATFPEKLVEPCILAGSKAGDIILDPFAGSGVTGVVAKKFGRRAILIDLKREYCAMAIKRLPKQERLAI